MPLVAFFDGHRIESYLSTDEDWDQLKGEYKNRVLTMKCGLPGIPRKSKRGLKHFAHKAGDLCGLVECWAETPEHRAAKTLTAQAARDAGWQVSVEWSPEGGAWTADVLAELDGRRIALEVQWSRQDAEEFRHRQERYVADGVECFWYVHRRNADEARRSGVPHVVFEGDRDPFDVTAAKAFQQPEATSLHAHVIALLQGLHLDRIQAQTTSVIVQYLSDRCFACKRPSTIWRITAASLLSRCQETGGAIRTGAPLWAAERIETLIAGDIAAVLGKGGLPQLAPLRMHKSKQAGKTYLAYGCVHCRAGFFGDGFLELEDRWQSVTVPVTASIPLGDELLTQVHLCADKGFGTCSQDRPDLRQPLFEGYITGQHRRTQPTYETAAEVSLVGTDISARDAVAIMVGHQYTEHEESTSGMWSSTRKKATPKEAVTASCDWCEKEMHPEHECLWRRLRAKSNVDPTSRHWSDGVHHRIASGIIAEEAGTAMMKRFTERGKPILPSRRTR
ncbi:hypothetical protein RCH21_002627 [Arthrobacter sp. PL16]|uniref:competence protein CoiA n=1 Tax=Arthrobacter sp. PL16 TaxID=3071720 RepID=UPI002E04EBDA|nr:hypothetical protein [Arthrobacter sp. PL16]